MEDPGTDFELRDTNGHRTMTVEEFRAAVTEGLVHPETFIKSVMTQHRWIKAADSPMYNSLLSQAGYSMFEEKQQPSISPEEAKRIGRKILKVMIIVFVLVVAGFVVLLSLK